MGPFTVTMTAPYCNHAPGFISPDAYPQSETQVYRKKVSAKVMSLDAINSSGSSFGVGMGKGAGKGAGKHKNKHKGHHQHHHKKKFAGSDDGVDESQVLFCNGLGCCWSGCLCSDCIGCSGEVQLCCLTERFCCKSGSDCMWCTPPPDECCQLGCGCFGCGCTNCMAHTDDAGVDRSCSCFKKQIQLCCWSVPVRSQRQRRSHV